MTESGAVSAGVLFGQDPVSVERYVLRPWAMSETRRHNLAAAVALGLPNVLGHDGAGARALARHWSRSSNPRMVQTATFAYGTLLGAWDELAQGAIHLMRIRRERDVLRPSTRWALASLMTAGAGGARARAEVIAVLASSELGSHGSTPYDVLPSIATQLVARRSVARESLDALFGPDEASTFDDFARLVAQSFLSDYVNADATLAAFVTAAADGSIDEGHLVRLIEAMKDSVPRTAGLGSCVERSLVALRKPREGAVRAGGATRVDRQTLEVLDRLDETFFSGGAR